jgi:hypothetical protein
MLHLYSAACSFAGSSSNLLCGALLIADAIVWCAGAADIGRGFGWPLA